MDRIEFFKVVRSFIDDFDYEDDLLEIQSSETSTDYLFGNFDDLLLVELFNKYKIPLAVVQDISEDQGSEYKIIRRDINLENYSFTCQLVDSIKFPKQSEYRLYVGLLVSFANE